MLQAYVLVINFLSLLLQLLNIDLWISIFVLTLLFLQLIVLILFINLQIFRQYYLSVLTICLLHLKFYHHFVSKSQPNTVKEPELFAKGMTLYVHQRAEAREVVCQRYKDRVERYQSRASQLGKEYESSTDRCT